MSAHALVTQALAAPARLRTAALVVAACAVALVVLSVLRATAGGGGSAALVLPLVLAVAQLGTAAGLLLRVSLGRLLAGAMLVLTGLLYVLLALGEAEWWIRVFAVAEIVVSAYAAVLLVAARERSEVQQ